MCSDPSYIEAQKLRVLRVPRKCLKTAEEPVSYHLRTSVAVSGVEGRWNSILLSCTDAMFHAANETADLDRVGQLETTCGFPKVVRSGKTCYGSTFSTVSGGDKHAQNPLPAKERQKQHAGPLRRLGTHVITLDKYMAGSHKLFQQLVVLQTSLMV